MKLPYFILKNQLNLKKNFHQIELSKKKLPKIDKRKIFQFLMESFCSNN